MYAVTIWKDVPFGGMVLLLTLFLADVVRAGGKNLLRWQGTVHFVLLCLGTAFLRNNGLYLLVCVFLVAGVQPVSYTHLDVYQRQEMYVDAFVDIAKAGKITGASKSHNRFRQVYAFGAGTKKMYDYMDNNPELMAAPVDYTNDVRVISQLDNFISINNAVNLALFGQVNAESAGTKPISGAGGQLDFVLGAYLSKGGKSFICCSSTFTDKQGKMCIRDRSRRELCGYVPRKLVWGIFQP